MSLRVAFYSHNGYGLGHVTRNLKLARGLLMQRPSADVLIITGAASLNELPLPSNVDYLKLPSVRKQATGRWRPQTLDIEMERLMELRRNTILEAVRAYRPHLFVADYLPLGVEGELIPALEELRTRSDAHTVIGFRDILDEPAVVRQAWDCDGVLEAMERLYDLVLVYGQPDWFDFSAYGLRPELPRYVGLLGDPDAATRVRLPEEVRILASCGGGADGYEVLAAAVEAVEPLRAAGRDLKLTVLTGPLMPELEVERLRQIGRRNGAHVRRFADDFGHKMARAWVVVGMGGSNTVLDMLSYHRPAVVVPRPAPSQEQVLRGRILAERGLATVIPLGQCTSESVSQAISDLLDETTYPEEMLPALDGVSRAVDAILELAA